MKKSKTLIIAFAFPPYIRVGARRWEIFARELDALGHEIHVFTSNPLSRFKNFDDSGYGFKIHRVDARYPEVMIDFKKDLLSRLKYKLFSTYYKFTRSGDIYDYTINWTSYFMNEIPEIIEREAIENVILTGGPYRYFFYALRLKESFNVNLILDYRDPWTTRLNYLSNQRQRLLYEEAIESECLTKADKILTASEDVKKGLIEKFGKEYSVKITSIENGIDSSLAYNSVEDLDFLNAKKDKRINLLYFGSIHCDYDHFIEFTEAIKAIVDEGLFDVGVTFYGNINSFYNQTVRAVGNVNFRVEGRISPQEFLSLARTTDYFLYFKPVEHMQNSFGVKFFDYLRGRRQIILISPDGVVKDFLKSENLGVALNPGEMFQNLKTLFQERVEGKSYVKERQMVENKLSSNFQTSRIESLLVKKD